VSRAKKGLGCRPRYDLKTGLKEAIEWYRQNGYLG
jgi:nucleoside-diphosphate-sugar epimerase